MAKKITELTEETSPLTTDIVEITIDPGGTPLTRRSTLGNLPSSGGGGTIIDSIPCVVSVPQGSIASPNIHSLVTQDSKVSGHILPDGATLSEINFKCKVPDALNASPAAKIRVTIMTLGASTGDIRLQVSTKAAANTENIDLAFDVETETTRTMPTAIETMHVYEQALTNQPSVGDFYTGQLKRDPVDSLDTYPNGILIVAIELIVTRDT